MGGLDEESILRQVESTDDKVKLSAVKNLKNKIIGSDVRKRRFLHHGAVPKLSEALKRCTEKWKSLSAASSEKDSASFGDQPDTDCLKSVMCEILAVLGCLARLGPEATSEMSEVGAINSMVDFVSSTDKYLKLYSLKSLRAVVQKTNMVSTLTLRDEHIVLLAESLISEEESLAKPSAYLISRLCEVSAYRDMILETNALTGLLRNLRKSPETQISVLLAMKSLLRSGRKAANQIMGDPDGSSLLFRIAKSQTLDLKLPAYECISILYKHRVLHIKDILDVRTVVIPGLMKILRDKSFYQSDIGGPKIVMPFVAPCARILWTLISDDEQMENAARNEKIESLLNSLISKYIAGQKDEEVAVALLRLASVFVCRDSSVCQADNKGLDKLQIVRCIAITLKNFEIPEPRIAALDCLRNMMRTFKVVAVTLKDMNKQIKNLEKTLNLIPLILKSLVEEASVDVQQASLEALCNVLFPFSVLHNEFLEQGGISVLSKFLQSEFPAIQESTLCAFTNVAYLASLNLKKSILDSIQIENICNLAKDENPMIARQALALLRNLSYGQGDLETLFGMNIATILQSIEAVLRTRSHLKVVLGGLDVLCNLSANEVSYKNRIVWSEIPKVLMEILSESECYKTRPRILLVLINLCWREWCGYQTRKEHIQSLGLEDRLKLIVADSPKDIQDRAKFLLDLLENQSPEQQPGFKVQ